MLRTIPRTVEGALGRTIRPGVFGAVPGALGAMPFSTSAASFAPKGGPKPPRASKGSIATAPVFEGQGSSGSGFGKAALGGLLAVGGVVSLLDPNTLAEYRRRLGISETQPEVAIQAIETKIKGMNDSHSIRKDEIADELRIIRGKLPRWTEAVIDKNYIGIGKINFLIEAAKKENYSKLLEDREMAASYIKFSFSNSINQAMSTNNIGVDIINNYNAKTALITIINNIPAELLTLPDFANWTMGDLQLLLTVYETYWTEFYKSAGIEAGQTITNKPKVQTAEKAAFEAARTKIGESRKLQFDNEVRKLNEQYSSAYLTALTEEDLQRELFNIICDIKKSFKINGKINIAEFENYEIPTDFSKVNFIVPDDNHFNRILLCKKIDLLIPTLDNFITTLKISPRIKIGGVLNQKAIDYIRKHRGYKTLPTDPEPTTKIPIDVAKLMYIMKQYSDVLEIKGGQKFLNKLNACT